MERNRYCVRCSGLISNSDNILENSRIICVFCNEKFPESLSDQNLYNLKIEDSLWLINNYMMSIDEALKQIKEELEKRLEKRIEKLEKVPHKCPVCDGKGNEPFVASQNDCLTLSAGSHSKNKDISIPRICHVCAPGLLNEAMAQVAISKGENLICPACKGKGRLP